MQHYVNNAHKIIIEAFCKGLKYMEGTTYLELLAKYGVGAAHPGGFALTKELLCRERINTNTVLLDIGCGTGLTSAYIAKTYPCRVIAADINPEMLKRAEQRFKEEQLDIELLCANATQLPFPANSFNLVLAESVTIFTPITKSLSEYRRVLKPGGILIDIEMTAGTPFTTKELQDVMAVYGIGYVPTQEDWRDMLTCSGFSSIQVLKGAAVIPQTALFSHRMLRDFLPHLYFMKRYQKKLGYRVFRCIK